ncbi:CHY zinc finger protein [Salegentibacter sp. F14]
MKPLHLFCFCILLFYFNRTNSQEKMPKPLNIFQIQGTTVYGQSIDKQTRCVHWNSALDVIAIKFKCCEKYYPCFSCHEEDAEHEHQVWPKTAFSEKAILCGVCGHELSIDQYLESGNTCPNCSAGFNPGCSNHYHLYFETSDGLQEKGS